MTGADRRERAEALLELAEAHEALFADGWDDAIVGLATQYTRAPLVVYDVEVIIATLIERDGMDLDDAWDYLAHNIAGAWMGDGTPLFLERVDR
jgi:hypothetical protein